MSPPGRFFQLVCMTCVPSDWNCNLLFGFHTSWKSFGYLYANLLCFELGNNFRQALGVVPTNCITLFIYSRHHQIPDICIDSQSNVWWFWSADAYCLPAFWLSSTWKWVCIRSFVNRSKEHKCTVHIHMHVTAPQLNNRNSGQNNESGHNTVARTTRCSCQRHAVTQSTQAGQ